MKIIIDGNKNINYNIEHRDIIELRNNTDKLKTFELRFGRVVKPQDLIIKDGFEKLTIEYNKVTIVVLKECKIQVKHSATFLEKVTVI